MATAQGMVKENQWVLGTPDTSCVKRGKGAGRRSRAGGWMRRIRWPCWARHVKHASLGARCIASPTLIRIGIRLGECEEFSYEVCLKIESVIPY